MYANSKERGTSIMLQSLMVSEVMVITSIWGHMRWEFPQELFTRICVPCACLHPKLPHPMAVQCLQEQMAGGSLTAVQLYSYLGMPVKKHKGLSICSVGFEGLA